MSSSENSDNEVQQETQQDDGFGTMDDTVQPEFQDMNQNSSHSGSEEENNYEQNNYEQNTFNGGNFDQNDFQQAPAIAPRAVVADMDSDDYAIIRQWNAKWREHLAEKDAQHNARKAEIMAEARAALDTYYELRQKTKDAKATLNRQEEAQLLEDLEQDKHLENPWKRVVKMVELNQEIDKTKKDVGRFKSILIKLKEKPLSASRQVDVKA